MYRRWGDWISGRRRALHHFVKRQPVSPRGFSGITGFLFPLVFKGIAPVSHLSRPVLHPPDSPSFLSLSFSVCPQILWHRRTKSEARPVGQSFLYQWIEPASRFRKFGNTACGVKHPNFRTKSPSQDLGSGINADFPAGNINNLRRSRAGYGTGSDSIFHP